MVIISESNRRTTYAPTTPTVVFPVEFPLFDNGDLQVFVNGEEIAAYTVSATYLNGITVDAQVNLAGGGVTGTVVIEGARIPRRTDQYKNGAPLKIEDHNYSLNRIEATLQELRRDTDDNTETLDTLYDDVTDLTDRAEIAARLAEESSADAQNAKDAAESAAGANLANASSAYTVTLTNIPVSVNYVRTAGYSLVGDGGAALYKRVVSEPAHAGKIKSAEGAWWELIDINVNVKQFGAKGDGTTDDYAPIMGAIGLKNFRGGGVVHLPAGKYAITSPIYLGDGSSTQVSTKDHRITLAGEGVGSHNGQDFVQNDAATELIYTGPVINGAALQLRGPLHAVGIRDLTINANSKAVGIEVNHVADAKFDNVVTKNATLIGWLFTTRSALPPGCAYGCGNNMIYHCYNTMPATVDTIGIKMTSGFNEAVTLTGGVDTANCDVIGGAYFYGGSANSCGLLLHGADNNVFSGVQFIVANRPSFAYGVKFQQWTGDPRFPLENVFINMGLNDGYGGNSGTLGNTILIHQEGDGSPLPTLPYLNAFSHAGVEIINGVRAYKPRRIAQKLGMTVRSSNSASYVLPSSDQSIVFANVQAGCKLRVDFNARVGKVTGGAGNFIIYRNGVAEPSTEREIPFNNAFQNVAVSITLDISVTGDQTIEVRYKSTDSNNVSITNSILRVEEYY